MELTLASRYKAYCATRFSRPHADVDRFQSTRLREARRSYWSEDAPITVSIHAPA